MKRALRAAFVLALLCAAGGKPAYFGEVSLDDGGVALMDGGIHGVQGHTLIVNRGKPAQWERRTESLQPSGKPGKGTVVLDMAELAELQKWSDEAWGKAGRYYPPIEQGPPRWVWAIVLRRGGVTRILEGGETSPTNGAPAAARPMLEWLIARVDKLAN